MEAALSIPDSRTSFAAAMSFLVSPTAMNGTLDSKTGVPPLMARSDAVAVVIVRDLRWGVFEPVCGVRGSFTVYSKEGYAGYSDCADNYVCMDSPDFGRF